jgi:putative ABC transport system ATP-binding protein
MTDAAPTPAAVGHPHGEVLVRARGIVKTFGHGEAKVTVLFGIDLDLYAGETTFIVGESGSGKTTLISILSAILTPEAGTVAALGHDLTGGKVSSLAKFRRDSIGFVFQQFNLLPPLTATENAAIPLLAAGLPRREAERRARELLQQLGIGPQADRLPNAMSGGQQQRVAIARALVHNPRIVVCDEPTASLDAKAGQEVMAILHDIAAQPGRAVLIVTHDTRTFHYADRIVGLEDGRIISDRRGPFKDTD